MRRRNLVAVLGATALTLAAVAAQADAGLPRGWLPASASPERKSEELCGGSLGCLRAMARRGDRATTAIGDQTTITFASLPAAEPVASRVRRGPPAFKLIDSSGTRIKGAPAYEQGFHLMPTGNGMVKPNAGEFFFPFWNKDPGNDEQTGSTRANAAGIPTGTERPGALNVEWVGVNSRGENELWLEHVYGVLDTRSGKLEVRHHREGQLKKLTPYAYAYRSRGEAGDVLHLVLPSGQAEEFTDDALVVTAQDDSAFSYVEIPAVRGSASTVTIKLAFGAKQRFETGGLGSMEGSVPDAVRVDVVQGAREAKPMILMTPKTVVDTDRGPGSLGLRGIGGIGIQDVGLGRVF